MADDIEKLSDDTTTDESKETVKPFKKRSTRRTAEDSAKQRTAKKSVSRAKARKETAGEEKAPEETPPGEIIPEGKELKVSAVKPAAEPEPAPVPELETAVWLEPAEKRSPVIRLRPVEGLRPATVSAAEITVPEPAFLSVDASRDSTATKAMLQCLVYLIGKVRDQNMKNTEESKPEVTGHGKTPEEESRRAFADCVYNEINAKIGGNNIEQFLCLLIPGIILCKEDYEYSGIKGPVVEANESRLANRMFDPCQMTNTDNGRTLPYQYKMALDMLSPKLNRKLALQKNKLRRLLMSKFPYDFGEGEETQYNMLEVYSRLYDEYMDEIYEWKATLADIRAQIREENPEDEDFENAYLQWYEDNAGDYLDKINEKKSKLLSVFSPNDMKILEGVLDSGSGAELQEARQNIYNLRKITPNGGYVYPVSFEPPNWFEMIGTSFTSAELMDSPEKIAAKIQRLSLRRAALYSSINDLSPLIDESFKEASNKIRKNKKDITTQLEKLLKGGISVNTGLKVSSDSIMSAEPLAVSDDSVKKLASKVALPALEIKKNSRATLSERTISRLVDGAALREKVVLSKDIVARLNSRQKDIEDNAEKQKKTLELSKNLTKRVVEFCEEKIAGDRSMARYLEMLKPLKEELSALDEEIEELNRLLDISCAVNDNMSDDVVSNDLLMPRVPGGFTRIEFEVDASSLDKQTDYVRSSSTVTNGQRFLFNGQRSSQSLSESLSSMIEKSKCSRIQVSMNIAKVGIVREWFNPGVFFLTSNMYRLCSEQIAPPENDSPDIRERLEKMKDTIFPCYPVSFVLARDMQIRFKYDSAVSEDTRELFEKHADSNGGFLFFRGREEYGHSDMAGVHTYFSDQTVTLKFDTTQVIGYYLQATAADKSTFIDAASSDEKTKNYSMADFSENYRQIINDRQSKE